MSAVGIPPRETINPTSSIIDFIQPQDIKIRPRTAEGKTFDRVLQEAMPKKEVRFSQHASNRILARGIELDEADMKRLENAIDKIEEKGGRESLVVLDENAFVVDVDSRTVITVMSQKDNSDTVFTKIDSAIVS